MAVVIAGFDWDDGNTDKCQQHGVSLASTEAVFRRVMAVYPDPAHSSAEQRFHAIGTTEAGRHVFIVFVLRERNGSTFIRPISARYMHRKEVRHYEAAAAEFSER
jgi:uncharacterized DUF497 family protein